ncbi:MAG: tripartite tricarboxylate transporter substrate binding protein [Betaproteobacteria bacterium]|nr:MAG: tripartite tricarboxylate transporter substrate binding protein [Betaproteobacteria bacterium]
MRLAFLAALAALCACAAHAQSPYPSRPIKFIAPFPPGGSSDVLCRLLGAKLAESLGQPVVVENRPGAGGNLAAEIVAKSPPDGNTWLLGNNAILATNHALYSRLGYDPVKDFAPVALVAVQPNVLVVHPSVPAHSVAELIAYAKQHPGKLNYASTGVGVAAHLSGELFKAMAGVDIVHIPYKGTVQAVGDLVAGQVQMVFADMVPAMPHIKAGRLRPLAVTTEERSPVLPDVPTMIESGVPGYRAGVWWAVMAPKGTPGAIIGRLNSELGRIVKLPDVLEKYASLGVSTEHSTPQYVTEKIKTDTQQFAKVLKAAGVEPE